MEPPHASRRLCGDCGLSAGHAGQFTALGSLIVRLCQRWQLPPMLHCYINVSAEILTTEDKV